MSTNRCYTAEMQQEATRYISYILYLATNFLDENVQVEFTKGNQGNFSSITMWWRDRGVSYKPREK